MDEVEDRASIISMDHEEMYKRKALEPEDTPHPKRIQHEPDCSDCIDLEWETDIDDFGKKPHIIENKTVFEYFFYDEKRIIEPLADIVERNDQLVQLIDSIWCSLRKAYVEGVHSDRVQSFDDCVKDLFNCQPFIQACIDTYYEDICNCCLLPVTIEIYKDEKEPSERMESLMGDDYLKDFLQDKMGSFSIARVVLCVLFGYWSDDDLCSKLSSEINYVCAQNQEQRCEQPMYCRVEKVVGVRCPASIEGLKDLFRSKYPEDVANIMCAQIDCKMNQYDWILPYEGKVITSYNFVLQGNNFYMPLIVFSDEDNNN